MRRGETGGDLPANPEHIRELQWTGRVKLLLQGSPGDKIHDQVGDRLVFDRIDGDDILVADGRRRPRFTQKPLAGAEVAARSGDMSLMATSRCSFSSNALTTMPKPPLPRTSRTS